MMQCVGVFISAVLFLGLLSSSCNGDFFNHRPFPTYSLEDMPETGFNCRDKILGGYYADPDAQCQMFHICVKVAGLGIQDFRFLCPNGTAFDQDHQICADWEDVDCDASTLYYSSDNFDLYRVGSGFESKLHKYGEDEETFALQRAETGDIRLNREPQSQVVNQQKSNARGNYNNNNNNNQEKDIFKASSSSSFFNNRNNGKENDEDYDDDDNVNANQNRDYENRRKVARKPAQRRPSTTSVNNEDDYSQTSRRPANRPTNGFVNNFAGSSYSTTSRPTTTTTTTTSTSAPISNNNRGRNNNNHRISAYTVSTPAPFSRQQQSEQQRFNNNNNNEAAITENYPSTKFQYKPNHASSSIGNKKPSELVKPTTFSPKAKPFTYSSNNNNGNTGGTFTNTQQHNSKPSTNTVYSTFLPTTFAPRTQSAFTDLIHKTPTQKSSISTYSTHYTPTVPRISSTTPLPIVSGRSNRFDETQYDYNEEEFLKTAHSQNIASSRNELSKLQKVSTSSTTTTEAAANTNKFSENYPTRIRNTHQSPSERKTTSALPHHPSSNRYTESNLPKITSSTTTLKPETKKKTKFASYDYAYYDSFGSEADYQIDTEIQKSKI